MTDTPLGIHLLIPHRSDRAVLAREGSAELPGGPANLPPNRPAIGAVVALMRDSLALGVPVLETHVRWDEDDDPPSNGTIEVLVLTEPPVADWQPPAGLEWRPVDGLSPVVPDLLAPRAAALLDELRADRSAPPPALRPRWARPGWFERASGWMSDRLVEAGRPATGPVEQVYIRGISSLLRVTTESGAAFMKASFPLFHHEALVARLLHERMPHLTPEVLAIEPDEGWLLMVDFGERVVRDAADDGLRRAGIRALVDIAGSFVGRTDELASVGCPRRPLARTPDDLAVALADPIGSDRVTEKRARVLLDGVAAAVERMLAVDGPETLIHGDFHEGNVAVTGDGVLVFDWSDTAIGSPLVDAATWLSEIDVPDSRQAARASFLDAWSAWMDPAAADERWDDILTAGAAYQVISYVGILRELEPATRYTVADGFDDYLRKLDASIPA